MKDLKVEMFVEEAVAGGGGSIASWDTEDREKFMMNSHKLWVCFAFVDGWVERLCMSGLDSENCPSNRNLQSQAQLNEPECGARTQRFPTEAIRSENGA